MHHHHHYTSQPPHHPPPSPPPPPPPPPPDAFETGQDNSGKPRCYYCGHFIAREEDIRKTEHKLGHGYTTMVMICPECQGKKERGEGQFEPEIGGTLIRILFFVVFGLAMLLMASSSCNDGPPPLNRFFNAADKSRDNNGLSLKVDGVETGGGFRVHMTATNSTKGQLTLPLFGYFKVVDNLGNQYEADSFSSTFPREVASGATISGYASMKSPLNHGATSLSVSFTTVFGSLDVVSITVDGVPVKN